jgi:hypothetical protein
MKFKSIAPIILLVLVLTACGPKETLPQFAAGSQAWIDSPLPGSHLPLAEVEILAHASSLDGINSFEIKLNGQLLAQTMPDPSSLDQSLMYTRYSWLPAAPGSYLIEVKAFDRNNQPGSPAQVVVEVGEPTPTITPTESQTPTPSCGPLTFITSINAYCRQGPGDFFPALEDLAMKGQPYLMDGRNADGSWFRIMLTPSEGCWVPAGVGTPSCDIGSLRVLADVPTPSGSCSSFADKATCEAHDPPCKWNVTIAGPGTCINK